MSRMPHSGAGPSDPETPAAVHRDDLLLDALGRGRQPADGDPALALLYGWRAELAQGPGADPAAQPAGHRLNGSRSKSALLDLQPRRPAPGRPRREPRRRRYTRRALVMMASGLIAAAGLGGVAVAAADAGPGSPLWPVTRAVYGERASSRQAAIDAERAIERARQAAEAGRTAEARRHLDEAEREAERVRQPREAERLRDEADEIRKNLPGGDRPDDQPSAPHSGDNPASASPEVPPSSGLPSESPSGGDGTPDNSKDKDRGKEGKGSPDTGARSDDAPGTSLAASMPSLAAWATRGGVAGAALLLV